MDLKDFLARVATAAKELDRDLLEARVYLVDFDENLLYLQASTMPGPAGLDDETNYLVIKRNTITGDAVIEDKVVIANKPEGYATTFFKEEEYARAAFPIEFYEEDTLLARTKYVLVVDKKEGSGPIDDEVIQALRDYSALAGMIISIKEFRDRLSLFYEENRNLVLSGRHSAAIAHDIRSLNVGVAGFLNLIVSRLDDGKDDISLKSELKSLRMARDNARQMEALLNNFSFFNRPELVLTRDTDLLEVVREKLASLRMRTDYERRVVIDLDLPETDSGVLVDPDWFGTVIENLVKNSIDACQKVCRIMVRFKLTDRGAVLIFEDNCLGIPEDILSDIFTPFISSKKRGQGLGLANA
ncbi:MAG: HAMP domain-containing histidine kinase, partial [Deltaproteobacteria bacterium]|nr:HAMP domain-containing histidine kinase [Deltaproteobacteria bacterium]